MTPSIFNPSLAGIEALSAELSLNDNAPVSKVSIVKVLEIV